MEQGHQFWAEDIEVEAIIARQRNEDMLQIEREVTMVSEIMTHLSVMVKEQGELLDRATDRVITAERNIEAAVQHLEKGLDFQVSSRGLLVDTGIVIAGTTLGALGFISSPIVGVPTLLGGILVSAGLVIVRRFT